MFFGGNIDCQQEITVTRPPQKRTEIILQRLRTLFRRFVLLTAKNTSRSAGVYKKEGAKMDKKEKAVALLAEAETIVSNARDLMDDKKLYNISGELLAVDTILCNMLKSQRQSM